MNGKGEISVEISSGVKESANNKAAIAQDSGFIA
jgi:hypothetical protein